MQTRLSKTPATLLLAVAALVFAWAELARAAEPAGPSPWAGAQARIEKHRMAGGEVMVVDSAGRPVAGVEVTIEQTRHAFLFGSNIFGWGRQADEKTETAYRARFAELLNYATLPFYWASYEPRRGQPNHQRTEQVARWCKANGIATKGHPLAWNSSDPRWLPDDLDEIRRLQMARIDDCVGHFVGLIDRWDVVNEVTHFDRPEFVTRRAPKHSAMWKKAGQMEFTRECFRHARAAGPQATLLINDYRTDPAYEKVIEQLVDDRGQPMYDVIGIQSHMHGGTWTNQKLWDTCQRFARFGVPLHFTEMTVLSGERTWQKARGESWPSTAPGEAWQAKEVARIYTILFSHPAVEAITWWDFSDYHSWKGAPAGLIHADGTPKPVYNELKGLIKGKWWTKRKLTADSRGRARFRGFLGQYRVTVRRGDEKPVERTETLSKGQANRWVIHLP